MYQQINLYQPIFRRQQKIFSAATLLIILLLAMTLLLGLYAHARWKLHGLRSTSEDLTLNYQQLDARLTIAESFQDSVENPSGKDEMSKLQSQISKQTELLDTINSLTTQAKSDFGEVFETLAQQSLSGLWLTGITLNQDGSTEIRGTALNATLVPRYLQLMTQQPRLVTLNKGSINLIRNNPDKPEIDFTISYYAQGESG